MAGAMEVRAIASLHLRELTPSPAGTVGGFPFPAMVQVVRTPRFHSAEAAPYWLAKSASVAGFGLHVYATTALT